MAGGQGKGEGEVGVGVGGGGHRMEKPIPSSASTLHPQNLTLRSAPCPVQTPKRREDPGSSLSPQGTLLQHPEELRFPTPGLPEHLNACRLTHLLEIGESPAAQEKEGRSENCPQASLPGVRLPHPWENQPVAWGESLVTGHLAGVECGRPRWAGR